MMWLPRVYVLKWCKQTWTVKWEEFKQSDPADIGYFLDCDSGKANAIHWALEFANGRSNHLDKNAARAICHKVWPHMRKSKKMQLRHLDQLRGL